MSTTAVLAARYMTRFRCLAGDCEATCCGGGTVPVEESSHRRLKVLAAGDSAALELIERGIERTPHGPDFAQLRFDDAGDCSMRDDAGLCSIHRRFGHDALFEVCATFPRYARQIDDEVELFGTLACPEVARLALLADDAFELTHFTLNEAPRVLRNHFRTEQPPYNRSFKPVRAALVRLVSEPGYALAEKLFVLLWAADKLKGVLRQGGNVSATELEQALGALGQPDMLRSLAASFNGLTLDGNLAFSAIIAALRPPPAPRRGAQTDGFDAIWQSVVDRCGPALARGATPTDLELGTAWSRYTRLASVPDAIDARVELVLTRYVVNHLLTTPHMLFSSLFDYAYDLVVSAACLRFLLTARLAERPWGDAELSAELVRVTYSFVRAVEHSGAPVALRQALRAQGLDGLPHAVGFLAMWRRVS